MSNELGGRVGLDVTNFKEGITNLKNQCKTIETSFRASAAVMGDWANTSEGLKNRVDSLSQKLKLQKQELSILLNEYKKTVESEGAGSKSAESLANKMYSLEKSIKTTEKDLGSYSEKLKTVETSSTQTVSKTEKLKSAFSSLSEQSKKSTSSISSHWQSLKSTMAGFIGGIVASVSIKEIASNIDEANQNMAQMDSVLKSTKGAAGMTKKELVELAEAQAQVTTNSAETTEKAENMLLTFTQIGKDVFPDTLKATEDMATAMHMDATQAAQQLGKALNDPSTGYSKLQRVGVTFTKSQINTIKTMQKQGKTAEAQKVILNELSKEFGGSATAAGKTFTGQMKILENQMESAGVEAGESLAPIASSIMPKLKDGVKSLANMVKSHKGDIQRTVNDIVDGIEKGFTFISQHGDKIINILKVAAVGFVAWKSALLLANTAGTIFNTVQGIMAIKAAATATAKGIETGATVAETVAQNGLNASMAANPFGAVAIAVGVLAAGITYLCTQTTEQTKETNKTVDAINDECKSWNDLKDQQDKQASSDLQEIDRCQSMWDWINKNTDATGKLKGSKEKAKEAIDVINKTTGKDELKLNGDMVEGYKSQKDAIDKLIKSKKAKILLDAEEPLYKEALEKYVDLQNKQADAYNKLAPLQADIASTKEKINKAQQAAKDGKYYEYDITGLRDTLDQQQKNYDNLKSSYDKAEGQLSNYYSTIKDYDDASVAFSKEDYDKAVEIIGDRTLKYQEATGATKEQLKEQADNAETEYEIIKQRFADGEKGVTQEMVTEAENRKKKAVAEYKEAGTDVVNSTANGINLTKGTLKTAGSSAGKEIKKGLESIDATEMGKNFAYKILAGVDFVDLKKSISDQFSSAGVPSQSIFKQAGKNANGTSNWRGGLTWVGENGPELMNLPRGTQIIPSRQSMQIANNTSNKNVTYNYYQTIESPKALTPSEVARNTRNLLQQSVLAR